MSAQQLLPHSRQGNWGFGLSLATAVIFSLLMVMANATQIEDEGVEYAFLMAVSILFVALTLVAMTLSWVAIIHQKDRGLLFVGVTIVITTIIVVLAAVEAVDAIVSAEQLR